MSVLRAGAGMETSYRRYVYEAVPQEVGRIFASKGSQMRYVAVTKSNHADFEVLRYGASDDGFQRRLDSERVSSMAKAFKSGVVCPDILVADTGDKKLIIDGQHRHAARKIAVFPVNAKVVKMSIVQAANNFVVLNSTGKRVPLSLRLMVATDEASQAIRGIMGAWGVSPQFAYRAVLGASGKTWLPVGAPVEKKDVAIAAFVIGIWFRNEFKEGKNNDALYFRPAVIQAVCALVRGKSEASAAKDVYAAMKRANFRKDGALASRYGTSATSQRFMRNYFMDLAHKAR